MELRHHLGAFSNSLITPPSLLAPLFSLGSGDKVFLRFRLLTNPILTHYSTHYMYLLLTSYIELIYLLKYLEILHNENSRRPGAFSDMSTAESQLLKQSVFNE